MIIKYTFFFLSLLLSSCFFQSNVKGTLSQSIQDWGIILNLSPLLATNDQNNIIEINKEHFSSSFKKTKLLSLHNIILRREEFLFDITEIEAFRDFNFTEYISNEIKMLNHSYEPSRTGYLGPISKKRDCPIKLIPIVEKDNSQRLQATYIFASSSQRNTIGKCISPQKKALFIFMRCKSRVHHLYYLKLFSKNVVDLKAISRHLLTCKIPRH